MRRALARCPWFLAVLLALASGAAKPIGAQTALVQQAHTNWWLPANITLTTTKGNLLVIVARWQATTPWNQYQGAATLNESAGNSCVSPLPATRTMMEPGETVAQLWYCWNIKGGADQIYISGPTPGSGTNSELALTVDEFSGVDNTSDPLDNIAAFTFGVQYNEISGITTTTKDLVFNSWQDNNTDGWLDATSFPAWPWTLLLDTSGPPGQDTGLGHAEAVLYDRPAGPDSTNWTTQDNARNSVVLWAAFRGAGQTQPPPPLAIVGQATFTDTLTGNRVVSHCAAVNHGGWIASAGADSVWLNVTRTGTDSVCFAYATTAVPQSTGASMIRLTGHE